MALEIRVTSPTDDAFVEHIVWNADEIAKEVIQGKWGNGEERKKKLTATGYDFSVIQKKVNEILK